MVVFPGCYKLEFRDIDCTEYLEGRLRSWVDKSAGSIGNSVGEQRWSPGSLLKSRNSGLGDLGRLGDFL